MAGKRFIPTPVGNAAVPCGEHLYSSVHPHARGERGTGLRLSECIGGSSPRPWGTRRLRERWSLLIRFIPTPVGNAPIRI